MTTSTRHRSVQPGNNKLARYIDNMIRNDKFPNRATLARAVGMGESWFSKSVQDDGTLSVEQCLRLAGVLGVEFPTVLRLAKREQLALVHERLHKALGEWELSAVERELVQRWRTASVAMQDIAYMALSVYARDAVPINGSARVSRRARRLIAHDRAVERTRQRELATIAKRR